MYDHVYIWFHPLLASLQHTLQECHRRLLINTTQVVCVGDLVLRYIGVHPHSNAHSQTHTHTGTHICTHTYKLLRAPTRAHIHTHSLPLSLSLSLSLSSISLHIYLYLSIYISLSLSLARLLAFLLYLFTSHEHIAVILPSLCTQLAKKYNVSKGNEPTYTTVRAIGAVGSCF